MINENRPLLFPDTFLCADDMTSDETNLRLNMKMYLN